MSLGDEVTAEAAAAKAALEQAAAPTLMGVAHVAESWMPRLKVAGALLAILALCAFGAWVDHELTPQPIYEDTAPAPMVRQADESVIAERKPDPKPPAPRHVIPKGYVEERRESVVVAPAVAASSVEVDFSLVRSGTDRRVIASSPDGQVLSAIDIPIELALLPPAPRPWAAGLSYGTDRAVGVWLERDVGRLRLGAEVAKGDKGARAELRVGVNF